MTMAERITVHHGIENGNDARFDQAATRQRMEVYIKEAYPEAVLDHFLDTRWGTEYLFYPTPDAFEPYACIVNAYGGLTILVEF